jgi:hypothetical protein
MDASLPIYAQSVSAPTNTEEPPTLSAKEILKPDFLAGEAFAVQDEVPTSTGRNRYLRPMVFLYGSRDKDVERTGSDRALSE